MGLKYILSLFYKYKSQFLQLIGGHIHGFFFKKNKNLMNI
jgi:hypothetical protein